MTDLIDKLLSENMLIAIVLRGEFVRSGINNGRRINFYVKKTFFSMGSVV